MTSTSRERDQAQSAGTLTRLRAASGLDSWCGWGFVLCAASAFVFDIPLGLSRSGGLEITGADVAGAVLWALLAGLLVTRRWRPSGHYRVLAWAIVAFCAWFAVTSVLRFASGDEVLQPFLALRTTLIPLGIVFAFDAGLERPRRALHGLVVFGAILNLAHLPEWNNMRVSDFLGNSIVFAGVTVLLVPVSLYVWARPLEESLTLTRFAALTNLLAALVFPIWTGSRVMTVVVIGTVLASLVILRGARRALAAGLSLCLAALVAHLIFWYVNPVGAAYGLYRLVPPPIELGITPPFQSQAAGDLAQREYALEEMQTSDSGRAELIEISLDNLAQDPFIGNGQFYFPVNYFGVDLESTAHNFVLEHLNAYGALGFALYLGLGAIVLWPGLGLVRRTQAGAVENLVALLTTGAVLGFSLTQPTMLIMVVVIPLFVAVGALEHEILTRKLASVP